MRDACRVIIYTLLIALLLLGFICIADGIIELLGLFFLLLLTLAGFFNSKNHFKIRILFYVSLYSLTYIVFLWLYRDSLYLVLLFLALVVYLLSFPRWQSKKAADEELHSIVFDPVNDEDKK